VPRVRRSERESTPTAAPFAIVCSGDMATRLARQTWCGRLGAADLAALGVGPPRARGAGAKRRLGAPGAWACLELVV
jgi:hypothetical protein